MGKLQQYPVGSHNILDYQKNDLLISGRLGPIPRVGYPKWNVESKFVFAKMFVSLYLWC